MVCVAQEVLRPFRAWRRSAHDQVSLPFPLAPPLNLILVRAPRSLGLSMVMSTYHNEPKMLSGLVRSILWQFVGSG